MTDAGPRFLPGQQPIGYGMTPGVHHNVMTGEDDPPPAPETKPYIPGPGYPTPEKMDLDAPDGAPAPAAPLGAAPPDPSRGPPNGWRLRDKAGNVVAELHNVNTRDYQQKQVEAVGASLMGQAVTPEDKDAAVRAMAYGKSMAGLTTAAEITKRMVQLYENDQRNGISRSIQEQKNKRALAHGGGGGGPAGPSKQDKFENQVDLDDAKLTESVVNNEQQQAKVASLNDDLSTLDRMEAMASSKDPLSQRAAIAEYMKTLTGKQSTDSERNQILGAGGMIAKLESQLSLWSPTDASMSQKYISGFLSNLRTVRAAVQSRKKKLGEEMADRLTHQPRFAKKDEATKKVLGNYGRGVATGDYGDKPAIPEDLLK